VVDTMGDGRVVREWESPDVASLHAAGAGRVAATRSPYYVPQLSTPEPDSAPLIRMLDTLGRPIGGLATIRRPATPLLDYVVNAGAVAVGPDGAVYYAPLVRDEIWKYAPGGQVSWTTKRGLFPSEPDPEFLPAKGRDLRLNKALVNVALALAGDTVTLAGFQGKVTLVNFWASWCDPCREEFPHMAALYREFDGKDFEIAAVSDDVDAGKMLTFVRNYRPPFPILVGGGRM